MAPAVERDAAAVVFNVRDFGAVGDGETDDTDSVREAIAAAVKAGGGTIYFPAATYCLAPTEEGAFAFEISGSHITIAGAGADRSILSFYGSGGRDPAEPILKRGGGFRTRVPTGGSIDNLTFRDLRITGNAPPTDQAGKWHGEDARSGWDTSHKALGIWGKVDKVLIERCIWDNWRGEIIYAGGGKELGNFVIRDTVVYNCNASAISMTGGVTVEDSEIYDVYNAMENFAIADHHHTRVRRSVIEPARSLTSAKFGIVYIGTRGSSLEVHDNIFRNAPKGAIFLSEGAHGVQIRRNTFVDTVGVYAITLKLYPQFKDDLHYSAVEISDNKFIAQTRSVGEAVVFYTAAVKGLTLSDNRVECSPDGNAYRVFANIPNGGSDFIFARNVISQGTNPIKLRDGAMRPIWKDNQLAGRVEWGLPVDDFGADPTAPLILHPIWPRLQITALRDGVDGRPVRIEPETLKLLPEGFELELRRRGNRAAEFGVEVPPDAGWNTLERGYMLYKGAMLRLQLRDGLFHFLDYIPPDSEMTTLTQAHPSYGRNLTTLSFRGASQLHLQPRKAHMFETFSGIAEGQEVIVYYNSMTRIRHVPGVIELPAAEDWQPTESGSLVGRRVHGVLRLGIADRPCGLQKRGPLRRD